MDMSEPQPIIDKVIETLESATTLAKIKKWYLGQPNLSEITAYPFGWVEWLGGDVTPGANKEQFKDSFYVAVVDKHVDAVTAERSIMSFVKAVKDAIYNDRTLGGLVNTVWLTRRAKDKMFEAKTFHSVVGIGLTFKYRKRE